jgi:alcohol dehydrogenase class IV
MNVTWNYPTHIDFGPGKIDKLPSVCKKLSIAKPLLVCDRFLLEQVWLEEVIQHLPNAKLFSSFKPNPDETNIENGVNFYHDMQCDGVIGLGGGSALDCAKTIGFMVGQSKPLWNFIDEGDNYTQAATEKIAKIIAIPTTSGTGSEVGRASVIVNSQTHNKTLVFHPKMLPTFVICDPNLTLTVPPKLTATTGMDALAHNLEGYFAPIFHPMADGIALEGLRLIKENLTCAYNQGNDIQARTNMMAAATMGAAAFQKGLGLIHALSHPVGGLYDAHHGLLNAIFMPYVLRFNQEYIIEKCAHLARYLDLKTHDFNGVYEWIMQLMEKLSIPTKLNAIGIDESKADLIARLAMKDPSASGNPKPLTVSACKEVFIKAVNGQLN